MNKAKEERTMFKDFLKRKHDALVAKAGLAMADRATTRPSGYVKAGLCLGFIGARVLMPSVAAAADLPWQGPLESVVSSINGPVAKAICLVAICVSGVMMALGEGGPMGRKAGQLIFGISLAAFAATIVSDLFGDGFDGNA